MTPRAGILALGCDQKSHIVKMHYFCKNPLYSFRHKIDKMRVK